MADDNTLDLLSGTGDHLVGGIQLYCTYHLAVGVDDVHHRDVRVGNRIRRRFVRLFLVALAERVDGSLRDMGHSQVLASLAYAGHLPVVSYRHASKYVDGALGKHMLDVLTGTVLRAHAGTGGGRRLVGDEAGRVPYEGRVVSRILDIRYVGLPVVRIEEPVLA